MTFCNNILQTKQSSPRIFEPLAPAEPRELLKRYWGFPDFRHGQLEVIQSVLAGRDTLAVMSTGSGKSLCYQLPALCLPGLTLVVSPLIALMKDQVEVLARRGIPVAFINSTLTPKNATQVLKKVEQGAVRLLYVAPERFKSDEFRAVFQFLPAALFAVDEAHCVSHWGHDFRPDYLKLRQAVEFLPKRPIIMACTATATSAVKDDIVKQLGLLKPNILVRGFDRPNLRYLVAQGLSEYDRETLLTRFAQEFSGSGIVYAGTRDRTHELASLLQEKGVKAAAYHAGMQKEERKQVQEDFMNDKIRVIVATIAFGMGIDKPDVRFVIHAQMPASLEGYYQEAGRA